MIESIDNIQQRIDHSITSNGDVYGSNSFSHKVGFGSFSRCEVEARQSSGQFPISLFRPRGVNITSTQTRLYVRNWDFLIVRSQACSKGCCRIAMNKNNIRSELCKDSFHSLKNCCSHICQILARPHYIQIEIRPDREKF